MKKLFILIALFFSSAIFAATVDEAKLDKDCTEFHERVLHWRAEAAQIEGKQTLLKSAMDKFDEDQLAFKASAESKGSKDETVILLLKEKAAKLQERFEKIQDRKTALDVLIASHEKERGALREEMVRLTTLAVQAKVEHEAAPAEKEAPKK